MRTLSCMSPAMKSSLHRNPLEFARTMKAERISGYCRRWRPSSSLRFSRWASSMEIPEKRWGRDFSRLSFSRAEQQPRVSRVPI